MPDAPGGSRSGLPIPWPALGVSALMGLGSLWIGFWPGAGFFLGLPFLLLVLDQLVRRGVMKHPDERHGWQDRNEAAYPERLAKARAAQSNALFPTPELAGDGQAEVRAIVDALVRAGMFAPEVPDAALAFPHIADSLEAGASEITVGDVLHALADPREWFPAADPARWSDHFVLHETQVEQLPEYIERQAHDMVWISDGALAVEQVEAEWGVPAPDRTMPVTLRLVLNGEPQEWRWRGHAKYLSTILHAKMAEALAASGGSRRYAAFSLDQGFIFAYLEDGALAHLEGLHSWGHDWFGSGDGVEAGSTNA